MAHIKLLGEGHAEPRAVDLIFMPTCSVDKDL